jgi:CRISPR-associated protein Cas2
MDDRQPRKADKTNEKVSPYRMGWIVVLFDLPVTTDVQRREATKFRKFLLDDAYVMKQFSVYIRPCVSHEHMEKHTERLRQAAPHEGFVTALFITDKQYELAINFVGDPSQDEGRRVTSPIMPQQIVFW